MKYYVFVKSSLKHTRGEFSNCLFTTHMQTSSQFRKPSSPLKPKHPKYITSQQCAPIGCTRQEVGSLHSLDTTLYTLQQTYLRLLIHTTQNFTYAPHCHPWICGQTPPEWLHCWSDGRRSWLVDHKREHRTPPTSKGHGSG